MNLSDLTFGVEIETATNPGVSREQVARAVAAQMGWTTSWYHGRYGQEETILQPGRSTPWVLRHDGSIRRGGGRTAKSSPRFSGTRRTWRLSSLWSGS